LSSCEGAPLEVVKVRTIVFAGPRVKRTLLIGARPESSPDEIAALEASLASMPEHIDTIRSWALSRIDPALTSGRWTHVWEQEFAEAGGFRPYMGHPYHWTGVA